MHVAGPQKERGFRKTNALRRQLAAEEERRYQTRSASSHSFGARLQIRPILSFRAKIWAESLLNRVRPTSERTLFFESTAMVSTYLNEQQNAT